jgi:hypothetical protein
MTQAIKIVKVHHEKVQESKAKPCQVTDKAQRRTPGSETPGAETITAGPENLQSLSLFCASLPKSQWQLVPNLLQFMSTSKFRILISQNS